MSTDRSQQSRLDAHRNARVLVVDDNQINCLVAGNYCEAVGFAVTTAMDGIEAVALCSEQAFDLILMDIRMPRMNGIEASEKIRQLPGSAARVPIIAVTGDGDLGDRDLRDCDFQALLIKPISMHTLIAAVSEALFVVPAQGEGESAKAA